MELTLPAGSYAFLAMSKTGTGAVHATARVRNDGTSVAELRMCVGIYNQSWNSELTCSDFSLAAGAESDVAAVYTLPSGATAEMTNWEIAPTTGAATIAVDDGYVGYVE